MRGITRLVGVVIVGLSACTLTTSLDGFSNGGDGSSGGTGEGGSSGSSGEGGSGSSGGGRERFCATLPAPATMCEDFDTAPLPGAFGSFKTIGEGSVQIVGDGRSPPKAVLLTIGSSSAAGAASLAYATPAATESVVVECDFRVDTLGGDSFDLIMFENGVPEMGFQIDGDGAVTWDEDIENGVSIETPTTGSIAVGTWTHVRLAFLIEGNLAKATLALDGREVGTHGFQAKALLQGPNLVVGDDSFSSPSMDWRVRVDNVVLTVK